MNRINLNRNNFKKSEQSTHYQTARLPINEGLSYTFRAYHEKTKKTKIDINNHIFDLENTITINFDLINNIISITDFKNINERNKIKEKFNKIVELYKKRKEIKKKLQESKGRNLVQNQILEELKRNKNENLNNYSDTIDELLNALEKKVICIKKYQKKYDEVDDYIKGQCIYSQKWKRNFNEFEILPFLLENENLLLAKDELINNINDLNSGIIITTRENKEYKNKKLIINDNSNSNSNSKYDNLIENYITNNKIIENKNNKMKKLLNKITELQYNSNYKIKISKIKNNVSNILESDKNSMNHSLVSYNKLSDNYISTNQSKLIKNSIWDISCIEKTEFI